MSHEESQNHSRDLTNHPVQPFLGEAPSRPDQTRGAKVNEGCRAWPRLRRAVVASSSPEGFNTCRGGAEEPVVTWQCRGSGWTRSGRSIPTTTVLCDSLAPGPEGTRGPAPRRAQQTPSSRPARLHPGSVPGPPRRPPPPEPPQRQDGACEAGGASDAARSAAWRPRSGPAQAPPGQRREGAAGGNGRGRAGPNRAP